MKKLISLLLVAGMLLSLAACGGTNTADPSSSGSESSASGSSSEAAGGRPDPDRREAGAQGPQHVSGIRL